MKEQVALSVLLVGIDLPPALPEHWAVIGQVKDIANPQALIETVVAALPDVVLVDGDRLFDSALALARHLRAQQLPTKVVLLADQLEPKALRDAALAGVENILPRPSIVVRGTAESAKEPYKGDLGVYMTQPVGTVNELSGAPSTGLEEPAMTLEELAEDEVTEPSSATETTGEGIQPPKRHGRIIAFSSGRGGVGKTTLLVNLAISLVQETHEPVAILDLFIGDSLVLLNETARMTLSEIPEAVREVDLPLLHSCATRHESGVHFYTWFFAPERNLPDYIDPGRLEAVLHALRGGYTYILVDMPVTLYVPDLELLKFADEVIVVAVPWDLLSVRATRALTLGMRHWGVVPKLLLNRVESGSELTPEFVADQLQLPIWEKIPNQSRLVIRANNSGVPLILSHPESEFSQAIRRAARRLAGLPVEELSRRRFPFF